MKPALIAAGLTALSATAANAVQDPVPGKIDPRIMSCRYDPANPCRLIGKIGQVMAIRLPDDEFALQFTPSDSSKKKRIVDEKHLNFVILKFVGCLVKEPAFIFSEMPDGSIRQYTFELQTEPEICTTVPPLAASSTTNQHPEIRNASLSDGVPQPPLAAANLQWLDNKDELDAQHGAIYSLTITDPAGERAKRLSAARKEAALRRQREAERLLKGAGAPQAEVPTKNLCYFGHGDANVVPAAGWDDGHRTFFRFAGQRVPTPLKYGPDGKPQAVDFAFESGVMTLPGVSHQWGFVDGHTVGGVWNCAYNPLGEPPTMTGNPLVERVVNGGR